MNNYGNGSQKTKSNQSLEQFFASIGATKEEPSNSENLEDFMASIGATREEPQEEYSLGRKAAVLAKHYGSGFVGAIPDTAAMLYNIPAAMHNVAVETNKDIDPRLQAMALGDPSIYARPLPGGVEAPLIPSATEAIKQGVDSATNKYTETPEDMKHIAEGAEFLGSVSGPGVVGKALEGGKKGLDIAGKALSKLGSTKPAELAGAFATGTAMSAANEAGYNPATSMGIGLLSGSGATKAFSSIGNAGKNLTHWASLRKELLENGVSPDDINAIAKKHNITLPFNLKVDNNLAHFISNVILKTPFTTKRYKQQMEDASKSMVDAVLDNINAVSTELTGPGAASKAYRETLTAEKDAMRLEEKKLQDQARSFLTEDDKLVPTHTLKAIKTLEEQLDIPAKSAGNNFVSETIGKIKNAWGAPETSANNLFSKGFENTEETKNLLKLMSEQLETSGKPISVDKLVQQRSNLMNMINYGEVYGAKAKIEHVIGAIDKDIEQTTNKAFHDNWRIANAFTKQEIHNRVLSDFAKSLQDGAFPKEAYAYMDSPDHIVELEKMLGNQPKAKQIMASLKRAKLQEVFSKAFNADRSISHASFANIFNKEFTQQEMLHSLLGKENYKNLQEISKISQAYSAGGKKFANLSGTAISAQQLGVILALFGWFTGSTSTGDALKIGGGSVLTPYALSHLFSSPRFTNSMVKFARARKAGNLQSAASYQRTLKNIINKTLATQGPIAARKEMQESQREEKTRD
jgi:hypothetical protein